MIRGLRRWLLGGLLVGLLLMAGAAAMLVATEAGARWLVARATAYLPEALELGSVSGTLLRGLRFEDLAWRDAPALVSVDELSIGAALLPIVNGRIEITRLEANRVDVRFVEEDGPAEPAGPLAIDLPLTILLESATIRDIDIDTRDGERHLDTVALAGRLSGSQLRLDRLAVDSDWLSVDVRGGIDLIEPYRAELGATWRWSEIGRPPFAGELDLRGRSDRYDVEHSLTAPVVLATRGSISLADGGPRVDLVNEWRDLEWDLDEARKIRSPEGMLRLAGNLDAYETALDALAQFGDWPETRVALEGSGDLAAIGVTTLAVENELGRLSANGVLERLPEPRWQLDFELADVDPGRVVEALSGTLKFVGRTQGRLSAAAAPSGRLELERIAGVLNDRPVDGSLIVDYQDETLTIAESLLDIGTNSIRVAGQVADTLDLDVRLALTALDELLPEAAGTLRADLLITGTPSRPSLVGDVSGDSLAWRAWGVGGVSASGQLSGTGPSDAIIGLTDVSLPATTLDAVTLRVSGKPALHRIEGGIDAYGNTLALTATGELGGDGWVGALVALDARGEMLGAWSLRDAAPLRISAAATTLEQACLVDASASANACVEMRYRSPAALEFAMDLSDLPLAALPVALPVETSIGGTLDAEVRGRLLEESFSGQARLQLNDAVFGALFEGESVTLALENASLRMDIADNRLESVAEVEVADQVGRLGLRLAVEDVSSLQSTIDGQGSLVIDDVGGAAVFLPDVVNPRGRIAGSVLVAGTLEAPVYRGEVGLSEGAFGVRRAGIELTDVELKLSQSAPGRLAITGSARSGDGSLSLAGQTELSGGAGIRSELRISGQDFELLRLPDWRASASPDITVVLDDRLARVRGRLDIPQADIVVRGVPETAEQPSPDAVVHRAAVEQPARGRRIEVSVQTSLGGDVRLAGFGLTTRLEGGVRIDGGSNSPYRGLGSVSLREGRYKAYGQDLEIERGELIFNGPLANPELDIRAIRRAGEVVAGVAITGTPRRLRSEVFSEPPLSDAEALSYLMTGRPLTSASAGEGDLINQAAFALGMSQAGQIAAQLRTELGLETLAIEGGADTGRIVAGKRIGGRLLVEYGYGLIDKLGTLLLRYELTERLSLESRTGSASALDVIYTVRKK